MREYKREKTRVLSISLLTFLAMDLATPEPRVNPVQHRRKPPAKERIPNMALRVTRGLFRLWLVLSVLWIGGMGVVTWRTFPLLGDQPPLSGPGGMLV